MSILDVQRKQNHQQATMVSFQEETGSFLEIDTSSCASKSYKSERERELLELRNKGLAKNRRSKLKDCKQNADSMQREFSI